jgi:hypothetical protein
MDIVKYEFPKDIEDRGYRVFPDDLETDPSVIYHATPSENFDSIVTHGFELTGVGGGVSFAKLSSEALRHWCDKRSNTSAEGCIFAVNRVDRDR